MPDTQTIEAFSRLMADHEITVPQIQADGRRVENGWKHFRFRFRLEIAGEMILDGAPYRQGMGITAPPADVDIFASILSDVASAREYASPADDREAWIEWANDLGLFQEASAEDIRRASRDFYEIKARESLIVERIGEDALDALIDAKDEAGL